MSKTRKFHPFRQQDVEPEFVPYIEGERSWNPFSFEVPLEKEDSIEEESEEKIDVEQIIADTERKVLAKTKAETDKIIDEFKRKEATMAELIKSVEQARLQWIQELRGHIGEVVLTSVQRAMRLPQAKNLAVQQRISECLLRLSEEKSMIVYVHSDQKEMAEEMLKSFPTWRVTVNDNLKGGAQFVSDSGEWDASIEVVWDELETVIQGWLSDANAGRL